MLTEDACKSIFTVFALFILIPAILTAGENERKPPLQIDDVINRETVSGFEISPGGCWAAWVLTGADAKMNRRSSGIVVKSLEGKPGFILSSKGSDSFRPHFSPDGSALCFIRKEDKGKSQIYKYLMSGGDSEKLTSCQNGVNDFEFIPGGKIIFSAREDSTYRERGLKGRKDNTVVVADQEHYPPVRLFLLDPGRGKVTRLTYNSGQITEFAPSPDGSTVVYNLNVDIDFGYDHRNHPRQFLLELNFENDIYSAGKVLEIFTEPFINPSNYKWAPDSRGFYCSRNIASDSTDNYVSIRRLYFCRLEGNKISKVGIGDENGLGSDFFPVQDGVIAGIAAGVKYRNIFARIDGDEVTEYDLRSESGKPFKVQSAHGRDVVYLVSDGSSVPVIRHGNLRRGELRPESTLYTLNEEYRKKFLARSEVITWKGALDEEVEGILYYPRGYREGNRYPLIVSLHGGPSGYDMDFFSERWSDYPHALAGRGSFVLKVNYHGSGNYGLDWIESIKGHYYEYEVPDILGGVNDLIGRNLADPERTGIMGWSNGSILAIACCLESEIFKSLCAGAGDVNWTSDYGNCMFGAGFDNAYFGGPPWELAETYLRKSPLFRMEDLATPTLIMFGGSDRSVPTEQGWEHFRAMQQIGKAPVRFILFPGEGHGPEKLSHQRRKMQEELAWMDKYLFETPQDTSEAVSPGSPLHLSLKKLDVAMKDGLYGIEKNGVLTPETVNGPDISIGRFEVTRAQFEEFDSGYDYPDGTGNFPVSGITSGRAEEYCRWLSDRTGGRFRLPELAEMEKLLGGASSGRAGGNNLAYWAGYNPTPDEEKMLLSEIKRLEGKVSLIKEAGSFSPAAGGHYDLYGNVSEWVRTGDGTYRPFGLSAVSNPDERSEDRKTPAAYTGFRVCETE